MANTANNVTAGKPRIAGSIYRGTTSATLPTTADGTISTTDFKALGYISDDGVSNNNSPETEEVKAWGGNIVLSTLTGKEDKFTFKMIEALNTDVLKTVYGDSNVSGDLTNGITVHAKAEEDVSHSYIIDMVLKNNVLKRIVIPNATVSELSEITYKDNDVVGYQITLTAVPDSNGDTHREYIKQGASGGTGTTGD